ncbi:MAG TPA: histidine kinase dimerization/phospho-acceptor domain-containing protein [Casimicrobiaceae bacterium]|nr:histidine kinase dimerization/phospho-acceptor domain-containing protein [Casimicrobiaceae bacterium]
MLADSAANGVDLRQARGAILAKKTGFDRIRGVTPASGNSYTARGPMVCKSRPTVLSFDQHARRASQLREAHRRKDEFIAMLDHELRNPLAPIRTVAEVLRRTAGSNETTVELCAMLERQVRQMNRLIDDLLDVSRITTGKIRFRRERVDLAGSWSGRSRQAIFPSPTAGFGSVHTRGSASALRWCA